MGEESKWEEETAGHRKGSCYQKPVRPKCLWARGSHKPQMWKELLLGQKNAKYWCIRTAAIMSRKNSSLEKGIKSYPGIMLKSWQIMKRNVWQNIMGTHLFLFPFVQQSSSNSFSGLSSQFYRTAQDAEKTPPIARKILITDASYSDFRWYLEIEIFNN